MASGAKEASGVASSVSLTASKGKRDKKEYRLIELTNGLEALLIHEPVDDGPRGPSRNKAATEDDDDEEDDDEEDEDEDEDEEEEEEYSQRAACAMAVGVGSWANPPARPGAAHFLEHMLFLGTEKYPKENDYDAYLSKHGGGSNASTDVEVTAYHFEVSNEALDGAVDRFAQFFASPLMRIEGCAREAKAIEAEFEETVRSDDARADAVYLKKAGHTIFSKFTWGNSKSLHNGDEISRAHVWKLHLSHYHASNMKLALLSTKSLDDMETLVASCFATVKPSPADVENPADPRDWRRSSWSARPLLSEPRPFAYLGALRSLTRIAPVGKKLSLRMMWRLPSSCLAQWRGRPDDVCAHLLGYEGPGSATAYLRKEGLVTDLMAGLDGEGYGNSASCGSFFALEIHLTDRGLQRWAFVLDVCFAYLRLCRDSLDEEDDEVDSAADAFLAELNKISKIRFDYADHVDQDPTDLVENLATAMLPLHAADQPPEYLLKSAAGCPCLEEEGKTDQRTQAFDILATLADPRRACWLELTAPAFAALDKKSSSSRGGDDDNDVEMVTGGGAPTDDLSSVAAAQTTDEVSTADTKRLASRRPDAKPNVEEWFGTEYWEDTLDEALLERWADDDVEYEGLAFPGANPFVPSDLSLSEPPASPVAFAAVEKDFEDRIKPAFLADVDKFFSFEEEGDDDEATRDDDEEPSPAKKTRSQTKNLSPPLNSKQKKDSKQKSNSKNKKRKNNAKKKKKKMKDDDRTALDLWREHGDDDEDESDGGKKTLVPRPREVDPSPRLCVTSPRTWYCPRLVRFDAPLAEVRVRLRHPLLFGSALAHVAAELAGARTSEALAEALYPSTIAEMRSRVTYVDGSVVVGVGGFSEVVPRVLELVLGELVAQLKRFGRKDQNRSDAVASEKYERQLRNSWLEDPSKHARHLRHSLLCPDIKSTPGDKLEALKLLRAAEVHFPDAIRDPKELAVDLLVHGNAGDSGDDYARDVADVVRQQLGFSSSSKDDDAVPPTAAPTKKARSSAARWTRKKKQKNKEEEALSPATSGGGAAAAVEAYPRPIPPRVVTPIPHESPRLRSRVAKLLPGTTTRVVQGSVDPECPTTAVEFYWQLGPDSLVGRVCVDLLEAILEEPMYDRLRTREQLGYTVSCGARWTDGVVGFGARVVSDKAGPRKLETRLHAFFADFRKEVLTKDDFAVEEFLDQCHALPQGKLEKGRSLEEVADASWAAIADRLPFDNPAYEALAVQYATPRLVREAFDRLFGFLGDDDAKAAPKLVVAVVGTGAKWITKAHGRKRSTDDEPFPTKKNETLLNGDPVPTPKLKDALFAAATKPDDPYFPVVLPPSAASLLLATTEEPAGVVTD